jgi:hypothetical protein
MNHLDERQVSFFHLAPRRGTFASHPQLNLLLSRGIKDEYAETTFSPAIVRHGARLDWPPGVYAERESERRG